MPRTVEEILAHADELAARFEHYEPDPADEVDAGAVALLRAAVAERSEAERHLLDAVRQAAKGHVHGVDAAFDCACRRKAGTIARSGAAIRPRAPGPLRTSAICG